MGLAETAVVALTLEPAVEVHQAAAAAALVEPVEGLLEEPVHPAEEGPVLHAEEAPVPQEDVAELLGVEQWGQQGPGTVEQEHEHPAADSAQGGAEEAREDAEEAQHRQQNSTQQLVQEQVQVSRTL